MRDVADVISLTLIVILALAPVPVIYLFYYRYFLVKPSYLYHLEYFVYGAILALLLMLGVWMPDVLHEMLNRAAVIVGGYK